MKWILHNIFLAAWLGGWFSERVTVRSWPPRRPLREDSGVSDGLTAYP